MYMVNFGNTNYRSIKAVIWNIMNIHQCLQSAIMQSNVHNVCECL